MNRSKVTTKHKMSAMEIILRFIFGFLIPYVLINGIIFFLFIQSPTITILDNESSEYKDNKIRFEVSCLLPIVDVKTFYQETEIPYTKIGNTYLVDITDNGTYQIKVSALNKSAASSIIDIETRDTVPPSIDLESAVITGNTLIISVHDNQSSINYDNLYATLEDKTRISPSYTDKSSGTVQFQIEKGNKVVVHIEDDLGNHSETSFTIS